MNLTKRCMAGLAGLVLSVSVLAAPVEISGIKLDETVELQGKKLQLNGADMRYKRYFK
jgi:hypothetical protein